MAYKLLKPDSSILSLLKLTPMGWAVTPAEIYRLAIAFGLYTQKKTSETSETSETSTAESDGMAASAEVRSDNGREVFEI